MQSSSWLERTMIMRRFVDYGTSISNDDLLNTPWTSIIMYYGLFCILITIEFCVVKLIESMIKSKDYKNTIRFKEWHISGANALHLWNYCLLKWTVFLYDAHCIHCRSTIVDFLLWSLYSYLLVMDSPVIVIIAFHYWTASDFEISWYISCRLYSLSKIIDPNGMPGLLDGTVVFQLMFCNISQSNPILPCQSDCVVRILLKPRFHHQKWLVYSTSCYRVHHCYPCCWLITSVNCEPTGDGAFLKSLKI